MRQCVIVMAKYRQVNTIKDVHDILEQKTHTRKLWLPIQLMIQLIQKFQSACFSIQFTTTPPKNTRKKAT